jgi:TRAP-type C4-dicarboxylate transport system permease small subunit
VNLRTLLSRYLLLLKGLLAALAMAMIAMVFGNFFLRYGFESSNGVSEELLRFALVWAGFIAATVALAEKRHMAVLSVIKVLPSWLARAVLLLAQLACLAAGLLFLIAAWRQVLLNLSTTGPIIGWPLSLALYSAGLFFVTHAVPIVAWQMIGLLRGR